MYDGLLKISGIPWAIGTARKQHECGCCGQIIFAGEKCWRPVSHGADRMRRLKTRCVDRLVESAKATPAKADGVAQ